MDRQTSLEAVVPDVNAMRTLQENIFRLLGSDTNSLLPSVREKLSDLLALIRDTDALLSDHVLRGLIMLNNQPWQELLRVGDSASGQRSEMEKEMEEDLLRAYSRLDTLCQSIDSKLGRLTAFRLPDVGTRAGMLAKDRDEQKIRVERQAQVVRQLEQRKKDLDELLGLFQAPGIIDVIKGLIPREEELDVLFKQIQNPSLDLDLFKQGVKKFNANLDIIGEGRKFSDLLKARDALALKIKEQQAALSSQRQVLETIEREVSELPGITKVMDWRDQWLIEGRKLHQGWQQRLNIVKSATELRSLSAALDVLRGYLAQVRRVYEKPRG
ncbi:alpha-xenorhabdolysin family binary toxin subunit B [Pseudomonas putida]|uniref:alpha-xenorhabdolysin family binary toxin subunit B n=1 Tax=Pseudomonas putida TaxID=303 RepID=UPI0023655EE2|nr:alpha-xenorhabdolysin family binary toxin subunit B [Pseudomonas putida]MDD2047861.1 alpha-xenorhabdolysin family binary toxin subunit B [Pseudomonas putida]